MPTRKAKKRTGTGGKKTRADGKTLQSKPVSGRAGGSGERAKKKTAAAGAAKKRRAKKKSAKKKVTKKPTHKGKRVRKLATRAMERNIAVLLGVDEDEAHAIWLSILKSIRRALLAGRPVGLLNIGTLTPYDKGAHQYRQPATGELQTAKGRRHVRFVISPSMRKELAGQ